MILPHPRSRRNFLGLSCSVWGCGILRAEPILEPLAGLAVRAFVVTYDSDGLRVKGKLYLPPQVPAPAVILNHDGINGVTASTQERAVELAQAGFVVLAPSYRGEDGSQGEVEIAQGEVNDVLAAARWLQMRPEVRPERVGLVGMSHGALISLLAAGREPARFGALVFAYGVADIYQWYQFLQTTKQLGSDPLTLKVYGKGPEDVPENFRRRHGLQAVAKLQAPVLIVQGEKDTLTPPEQGQTLYTALRQANKQAELKLYPQATHGFLIYRNKIIRQVGKDSVRYQESLAAWETTVSFLRKYLK